MACWAVLHGLGLAAQSNPPSPTEASASPTATVCNATLQAGISPAGRPQQPTRCRPSAYSAVSGLDCSAAVLQLHPRAGSPCCNRNGLSQHRKTYQQQQRRRQQQQRRLLHFLIALASKDKQTHLQAGHKTTRPPSFAWPRPRVVAAVGDVRDDTSFVYFVPNCRQERKWPLISDPSLRHAHCVSCALLIGSSWPSSPYRSPCHTRLIPWTTTRWCRATHGDQWGLSVLADVLCKADKA